MSDRDTFLASEPLWAAPLWAVLLLLTSLAARCAWKAHRRGLRRMRGRS